MVFNQHLSEYNDLLFSGRLLCLPLVRTRYSLTHRYVNHLPLPGHCTVSCIKIFKWEITLHCSVSLDDHFRKPRMLPSLQGAPKNVKSFFNCLYQGKNAKCINQKRDRFRLQSVHSLFTIQKFTKKTRKLTFVNYVK